MIGIKRPVTERERQQLSRVRIVPKPPISLDCAVWRITAFDLVRRDDRAQRSRFRRRGRVPAQLDHR
jgi:hypothetical protein